MLNYLSIQEVCEQVWISYTVLRDRNIKDNLGISKLLHLEQNLSQSFGVFKEVYYSGRGIKKKNRRYPTAMKIINYVLIIFIYYCIV